MPEGLGNVVGLLVLGYLLLLAELFVPGGVVGIMGLAAVSYGCYLAFELGPRWGAGAILISMITTTIGLRVFLKSKAARRLMLSEEHGRTWRAEQEGLAALAGKTGRTLSTLRPSGWAEIEGQRVSVVADSDFLDAGILVRVVQVEGNRVVVDQIEEAPESREGSGGESAGAEQ